MAKILGDFIDISPLPYNSLELTFTPTSKNFKEFWQNQRLSAHFLADYFVNFLSLDKDNPEDKRRIRDGKGAISYIANELLENAMKFNLETKKYKVRAGIHLLDQLNPVAVMFTTNSIDAANVEPFKCLIKKLLTVDPEVLYIQQVEASAAIDNAEFSGLGLLTIINDYQAKLGWKFEILQTEPEIITVTTMAQIAI